MDFEKFTDEIIVDSASTNLCLLYYTVHVLVLVGEDILSRKRLIIEFFMVFADEECGDCL